MQASSIFAQALSDTIQSTYKHQVYDTILVNPLALSDTLIADSLLVTDTISADTVKKSPQALESTVKYTAADSISIDLRKRKVYLYNKAEINYEQINLTAALVDIDFPTNLITAYGKRDSLGILQDKPVFTEAGKDYMSEVMIYNYKTKKGRIKKVKTKEGEGYLHGKTIKKMPDNTINVKQGSYTTCELDHPHFEIRYTKAKVIPKDKIVSGPAYLVIEDVPIPFILPFGFFPNKKGQQSGILIPSYGESSNRGFYFEGGGYYWGISDKMDLELTGDIYTKGSWALEPTFRYKKRYGYNGTFSGSYSVNKVGEEGTTDYEVSKDFAIRWTHAQDPKARPKSRFNANVNIVSSSHSQYNPVSTQDYLSNTFRSSISYQTSFGDAVYLTASASHNQNTTTEIVNITLPQLSLSTTKFYPFRRKQQVGSLRWYENITVSYNLDAQNTFSGADSLVTFDQEMIDQFNNGMKHKVSASSSIKLLKYFNLTNSINYTERWYSKTIRKYYNDDVSVVGDEGVVTDTVRGFAAARDYSLSSSLSTMVYGMVNFKKGPVKAIRHVMTPSVSLSYRPDFGDKKYGYYDTYFDPESGQYVDYSIFANEIYGSPSSGKSGSINFGLSNNLEMKVKRKQRETDTIPQEDNKIKLIDNLSFSMSYNMAADSLNWSTLSVSGRTKLFDKLDVTYSASYDPYALDEDGLRINEFVWNTDGKLFRRDNSSWKFGFNYQLSDSDWKEMHSDKGTPEELDQINRNPSQYIRWDNQWSINLSYTLHYTNEFISQQYDTDIIQTLSFNGSVNITDKWKLRVRSGYDFEQKELSYTSLNLHRDLHCWQMSFNWIPFGSIQSWNFTIQAKSAMLQDLKLEKKKDFRDY